MSKIRYNVFGNYEEYFSICDQCSSWIKHIKKDYIENMLRKYEHFGRGEGEQQRFPYVIKFEIDNTVYCSKILLTESDKNIIMSNTEVRELWCGDDVLECRINILFSSKFIEMNELKINGWIIYKDKKFECSQTLKFDFTNNNKYRTPGFPVASTYTTVFSDRNGETIDVFIDIVSEVIDELHIMNINDELQENFLKNGFYINSVCTGWHKFFGQYRYISPNLFSTLPETFLGDNSDLTGEALTKNIYNSLQQICMTDYNILLFCYSLYALGKSLLKGTKKYPIALNIMTDCNTHDESIKIARKLLFPVSLSYQDDLSELFCNNSKFTPKKYLSKAVSGFRREEITSKIHMGRFRDITIVSAGKHVRNKYNKKPDFEKCTISNEMLQNKLISQRAHVFFNLDNKCSNLILYKPCDWELSLYISDSDYDFLAKCSMLLVNNMILFMENDINDWTLRIKNNLKSVHNKIVFEINIGYFENFIMQFIIECLEKIDSIDDKVDFLQKVRYQDIEDVYTSELISNDFENMSKRELDEALDNMENDFIDNVMDNSKHRGEAKRTFGQIIDDIGYRLLFDESEEWTRFEELNRKKQHERIKEVIRHDSLLKDYLHDITNVWFNQYLTRLLNRMYSFTENVIPKKLSDFKRKANEELKKKTSLSSEKCSHLSNLYSMCLYFKEFINKEHPQCSELCDSMLERFLKIIEYSDRNNQHLADVNKTAELLGEFIYESGQLSLEKAGGDINDSPLYFSDGKGGLCKEIAGVYKSRNKQLCYFNGGDTMDNAFRDYLAVKGYTTEITVKRCVSDIFVPEKIVCTYKSRFSCEVTVNQKSQYAYKFYMEKLKGFCHIPDEYKPLSVSDIIPHNPDTYKPLTVSDL